MAKALGYMRTSSRTNVDGDSEARQRVAIAGYAVAHGITIDDADWFYDPAVKGADAVQDRPGFASMLDRIEGNGVRLVIVEDASRFARDLMTQELGLTIMAQRGVTVMTASGDNLTDTTDPTRIMMRQIAGAFAQYEKARLVAKLKGARDRATAARGYRKADQLEARQPGILGALAALRETSPDATLQVLADALTAEGYRTSTGNKLTPNNVRRMAQRLYEGA